MNRLTCYVYVTDETGEVHGFGPKSTVPEWARKKITNPNVWATAEESSEGPVAAEVAIGPGGQGDDGPPPQGGTGATRQRWAEYAATQGVEVDESWKREDIIAACEKAGKPV